MRRYRGWTVGYGGPSGFLMGWSFQTILHMASKTRSSEYSNLCPGAVIRSGTCLAIFGHISRMRLCTTVHFMAVTVPSRPNGVTPARATWPPIAPTGAADELHELLALIQGVYEIIHWLFHTRS